MNSKQIIYVGDSNLHYAALNSELEKVNVGLQRCAYEQLEAEFKQTIKAILLPSSLIALLELS